MGHSLVVSWVVRGFCYIYMSCSDYRIFDLLPCLRIWYILTIFFFSIFHIFWGHLHGFVCSLHTSASVHNPFVCSDISTIFTYWRSGTLALLHLNLWQLGHFSGFEMYISTLVIVYPIFYFISVVCFGVLKLKIYVFVRIVWLFFLMKILWASLTHCSQRLVLFHLECSGTGPLRRSESCGSWLLF